MNDSADSIPSDTIARFQEDLVRKIRLQRGVHDVLEDSTSLLLKWQKIVNVVITSFITLIVFADFGLINDIAPAYSGKPASITVGLIAFSLFVINSLADVFQLSSRNSEHQQSIQFYTDLLADLKKNQAAEHEMNTKREILQQQHEHYLQITNFSKKIGGNKFERAQSKYLKRKAIRLAKKKEPFLGYFKSRKEAKLLADNVFKSEGKI